MKDIAPAKHTELSKDQLKQLLNTLHAHDENGKSYIITPINWAFVDLDMDLDDLPLDDYEDDEDMENLVNKIPEDLQPIPATAYDSLAAGLAAAVAAHKLMVIYFEDDDYVEIDPETASELLDEGAEKLNALKTKDEILEFMFEILGV